MCLARGPCRYAVRASPALVDRGRSARLGESSRLCFERMQPRASLGQTSPEMDTTTTGEAHAQPRPPAPSPASARRRRARHGVQLSHPETHREIPRAPGLEPKGPTTRRASRAGCPPEAPRRSQPPTVSSCDASASPRAHRRARRGPGPPSLPNALRRRAPSARHPRPPRPPGRRGNPAVKEPGAAHASRRRSLRPRAGAEPGRGVPDPLTPQMRSATLAGSSSTTARGAEREILCTRSTPATLPHQAPACWPKRRTPSLPYVVSCMQVNTPALEHSRVL